MAPYALAIFLSAFLLFQVQPLVSKFILPWFGGSPTVWSTTMLFFQVALTGGYAFAHHLTTLEPKRAARWHVGALVLAFVVMAAGAVAWGRPLLPGDALEPSGLDTPVRDIFVVLLAGVGAPFFVLATNATLQQAYFSRRFPGASPWRLYAVSNLGSLLGLLSYPVLVEPRLSLPHQAWVWALGFSGFVALTGATAWRGRALPPVAAPEAGPAPAAPLRQKLLWVALAACASAMLLAATSQLTQEVAPIPFLWVLPLVVYLSSFILTFESDRWYRRAVFVPGLFAMSALVLWMTRAATAGGFQSFLLAIGAHLLLLFVVSMVCHGELVRLRPAARELSVFYLLVSVGGAVGGAFVNLAAPVLFDGYWEFPLCLLIAWVLLGLSLAEQPPQELAPAWRKRVVPAAMVMGLVFGGGLYAVVLQVTQAALLSARNFYGTLRIERLGTGSGPVNALLHGTTLHGWQYIEPEKSGWATSYFTESGGAGLALLNHPKRAQGLKVGVLGLGAGVLASYCREQDDFVFYEINPDDIRFAQGQGGYLTFLQRCPHVEVVAGDARLMLERELEASGSRGYDVLVLDVFSSDSVPAHLLTKEALEFYLAHLAPGGLVAANISNRHLDLKRVLWGLAKELGLESVYVPKLATEPRALNSQWMLLSKDDTVLGLPAVASQGRAPGPQTPLVVWTDDRSNLLEVLDLFRE